MVLSTCYPCCSYQFKKRNGLLYKGNEAQSPLLVCVFSAGQERLFLELRKRLMTRTNIMQLTMCVEIQVHATILAGALTVDNY